MLSPEYCAVILCCPAVKLALAVADPLPARGTLASVVLPSRSVTVPVGVPCPFATATTAVNVTDSPALAGFVLELTAVVVAARFTA